MRSVRTERARSLLMFVHRRYNPENDIIPDAPVVTHTDATIANAVAELVREVEELREKVIKLERGSD